MHLPTKLTELSRCFRTCDVRVTSNVTTLRRGKLNVKMQSVNVTDLTKDEVWQPAKEERKVRIIKKDFNLCFYHVSEDLRNNTKR